MPRGRWILTVLLFLAFLARVVDLNWDDFHHLHPDERWITMVALHVRLPAQGEPWWDPDRSPLNPFYDARSGRKHTFAYGHLPLYLVRFLADGLARLGRLPSPLPEGVRKTLVQLPSYNYLNLLGRLLSALADTVTVWLVYRLGRRLYGEGVGLLAAALLATTVLHIQLSHFYAFDVLMTTFLTASLLFAVRVAEGGGRRDALLAGAFAGLAVSSKFTASPVALALIAAPLLAPEGTGRRRIEAILLSGLAALAAFALTSPFSLLDWPWYLRSLQEQSRMVRGVVDLPYTRQYRNTSFLWYHLRNQLRYGMGWTVGLAAFAGGAWALLRALRRGIRPGEGVLLTWVVPYFLIVNSFMVKFMRYFILLIPFLVLFGAALLVQLRRGLEARWGRRGAWVGRGLIGLVLAGGLLWALAFLQIYRGPLTRVEASEWIYRNLPPGTAITWESWDDPLPLPRIVDGRPRHFEEYRTLRMDLYEPDGPAKVDHIVSTLLAADYVILSSNRIYGWVPRLADRYPVLDRYYRALFSGELGFEEVARFTRYPRLGPWVVVDDDADESFTVYDHPKVLIFKKVRALSEAELRALFAEALRTTSRLPGDPPERRGQALLLTVPLEELPAPRDWGWNGTAHPLWAGLAWWAVLTLMGAVLFPLTYLLFRNFRDRGWGLSRLLGLLAFAYGPWLLGHLGVVQRLAVHVAWGLGVALLSWGLAWQRRGRILAFLRRRWRWILIEEGIFAAAFAFVVVLRALNPDLWQPWYGGEKPMELAFLTASLRTPYFPPYDPYFAGGVLNYYYYGLYLVAVLARWTGLRPEVAFNLGVAGTFALAASAAFSLGSHLHPRRPWAPRLGAAAVALTFLMGNLDGWLQLRAGLTALGGGRLAAGVRAWLLEGQKLPPFDYWRSTRLIPNVIHEFPYFSTLFADLHPHLLNLPLVLLSLALGLNLLLEARRARRLPGRGTWWPEGGWGFWIANLDALFSPWTLLAWGVGGLTFGALAIVNPWDLPTQVGLLLLVGIAWTSLLTRRLHPWGVLYVLPWPALGLLLYLPFFRSYQALPLGVGWVRDPTPLRPFLVHWLPLLLLVGAGLWGQLSTYAVGEGAWGRLGRLLWRHGWRLPELTERRPLAGRSAGPLLPLLLATEAGLWWTGRRTLALLLPLWGAAGLLLLARRRFPRRTFTLLLAFWGLSVLVGVEVIYLRDFLGGGPFYRMNTVFKFYLQAWVLLGIAAAGLLPDLWAVLERSRLWLFGTLAPLLLLVTAAAFVYLPLGTRARIAQRFPVGEGPRWTLDGSAFMATGVYTWPDAEHPIELRYDLEAIRWLREHEPGLAVVAEAPIPYYREFGGRVSSFTGLAQLLGAHQNEQRPPEQVGRRSGQARELFQTQDPARARQLLEALQVRYVYVGQLEEIAFPGARERFAAFAREGLLEEVFRNEKTVIYRVVR